MSLQPSWYPWPASFNQPTREAGLYAEIVQMRWTPSHFLPLIGITSLVVKNIMSNQEEDTGGRDRVTKVNCLLTNDTSLAIFWSTRSSSINWRRWTVCIITILSFLQLQVKVYILTHHYPRQLDIKNKRKMRISFPEIQPWTWEKKMIELWIELRMRVKLLWQCGGRG